MKNERNAFWEKAYSELQAHCQSLGLVFEVVDFRCGVRDIFTSDHLTTELCIKEIESCQRISDGPTFIVCFTIGSLSISVILYLCLSSQALLGNQYGHQYGQLRDDDVISWNLTESRMLQALRTAAQQAEREGDISVDQKHKFYKSVLEYEMEHGFLKTQKDASAVLFFRELPRLSKRDCKKNFAKFLLDVTADGLLDTEARELLANLKQRICNTGRLQPLCMELSKGAMDPSRKEHKEYLGKLCEQVTSQMKELISRNALQTSGTCSTVDPGWSWLKQEIFHHAMLSKEKCSVFKGRDSILGKISIAMWESTEACHEPLLVHGPSGVGKTALLCKLAQEMRGVVDHRGVVVLRLLGSSPLSSDVDSVLRGVCLQVCGALGLQFPYPHIANVHEELVRFFHSMLEDVSKQGDTLLLILDSLDQLLEANKPHKLDWIPKVIPPNVQLVLSISDDYVEKCQSLVSAEQNIFRVELLTDDQGKDIIGAYMSAAGRKLTSEQLDTILNRFQQSRSPLHLKLMLDTAKQWSSCTSMSNVRLGISAQEVMTQFVESLEENHGKKLVSHALCFILLSRSGLSEAELQDVLSLDNDVLAEIYKYWLPPSHTLLRFPRLHWSRLRHDLTAHLTERWEGAFTFLRQFAELVRKRYLSRDMKADMHAILAEYFLGQWSKGQLRPILLPSLSMLLNADRKVPPQPLWFTGEVANMRKLHELPYHLAHAGKWEDVDWLCCKTLQCGVSCVIQDLSLCTDLTDCPEIQMLKETFLLLKPSLDFNPSLLVTEIFARLQGLADLYPSMIGQLCSQCVDWFGSCTDPVLVPKCSFFQAPGGPLKSTLTGFMKGDPKELKLLVAGSEDGLIIVWSLNHLQTLHTLSGHTGRFLTMKTLCVFLVTLTSMQRVLDLHHDASVLCAVSSSEGSEIITSAQDRIVWSVTTGALLDWIGVMDSAVSSLAVHQRTIISASVIANQLKVWQLDYNTKHRSKSFIPAYYPLVALSKDGDTVFYVKEGNKTQVFTWSCSEGLGSDNMDVSSEVCCMELAQQKRLLFCGLRTGTIFIYPLDFAPETLCLPPPESLPMVRSMAISPREDKMAVAYEDSVCLFEITSRDSFPCVDGPFERYSLCLLHSPISAMALLSDCRLLYGTFGGEVVIYDFKSATAAELDHHGAAITCITMSNWDAQALIGSQDCVQKLWNLSPVLLNHTMEYKGFYFEGVLCAVFSINDKYVFTGSLDKTIKVWDVCSGCLLYVQFVYSPVIKMMPHKDGFVAVSQHGSFIKEGFRCPDTLKPGYNPLRIFRAHYRVTSREKGLNAPHTVINELPDYNPAQFNFIGIGLMKSKTSNTCVLL
uniref:NACHT and WD repeat domain containing 1 n=1 Tax=Cyprinus carpio TaxID=7962 RepID=A0A8C2K4B0_CYPCA